MSDTTQQFDDEAMLKEASTAFMEAPPDALTGVAPEDDDSRLEVRTVTEEPATDEDDVITGAVIRKWGSRPSVRNQINNPDAVRFVDPETKILRLSDSAHLKEYNRIQKGATDPDAPTVVITEMERQQYEGDWTVFVTYSKVEYLQF